MKKGEIKRRKRVIPASHASAPGSVYPASVGLGNQSSHKLTLTHTHTHTHSQSAIEHSTQPRSLHPPPVDFTNFQTTSSGSIPSPEPSQPARKRTHSEANDLPPGGSKQNGHALPLHHDRRGPSPPRHERGLSDARPGAVDPSLANLDPSLRTVNDARDAEEKRAKLREERERVRAQLQALDAQLARIDDDP
jgi:hypothetical protein